MQAFLLDKTKISLKWVISRIKLGRIYLIHRSVRTTKLRRHPFDISNKVITSGLIPQYLLNTKQGLSEIVKNETHPYYGCSPNCLRAALDQIADLSSTTFIDLGCGMGRAAIIASEYPFRAVIGVELSQELCEIARQNAKIIQRTLRNRCPLEIINKNVADFSFNFGNIVVFMYNPFGPDLIDAVMKKLDHVTKAEHNVIILYENPVYFYIVDKFDSFERSFGLQIKCSPDERAHMFDDDEAIAAWRSNNETGSENNNFDIKIVAAGTRAELVF